MSDNLKNDPTSANYKAIFEFVERMVDKKIASDEKAGQDEAHVRNRNFLVGVLSIGITFLVGAGGIIATGISENHDRDHQTLLAANKRKIELTSSISNAITNIRELKDLALLECQRGLTDIQRLDLEKERVRRGFELVRVVRTGKNILGDKFRLLLKDFLDWEEAIPDYCSKAAPTDAEWLEKQRAIEEEMMATDTKLFF